MSINPDEDTEFNDALRKHGILPPRPKTPPSPSPPPPQSLEDFLDELDDSELLEFEDEAKDDETERKIREYHERRIEEQKKEMLRSRFGRIYPIGRDDYTREVTDASKVDELGDDEERGTGVVCFLYKDGIPRSDRAFQHVSTLAHKHRRTKFVSIVGDKCIPNLPDARIPMIIVYRKGDIRTQIIAWGADKERSLEELEALLLVSGAIDPPERPPPVNRHENNELDEEDDDAFGKRSKPNGKNIRSSRNDSDSDFEFDI